MLVWCLWWAAPALGARDFAGKYVGTISGSCGNASFAILADQAAGSLVFLAAMTDESGIEIRSSVTVDATGAFQISNLFGSGLSLAATVKKSGVTGTVSGPGCAGAVSASQSPRTGFFKDLGGYYYGAVGGSSVLFVCDQYGPGFPPSCLSGHYEVVGGGSGKIAAIIGANGWGFVVFKSSNPNGPASHAYGSFKIIDFNNKLAMHCFDLGPLYDQIYYFGEVVAFYGCPLHEAGEHIFGRFSELTKAGGGTITVQGIADRVSTLFDYDYDMARLRPLPRTFPPIQPVIDLLLLE